MKLTVKQAAEYCNGKIINGNENAEITNLCTDSREAKKGTLFIPIKGENTDAHIYIPKVFLAGAAATLTQEKEFIDKSGTYIYVDNTLESLQKIAMNYRKNFDIPVIGITGSVGKTTTKEFVALALSAKYNVMKTQGNHNSQIGLPLTMFDLNKSNDVAVIEMGMSMFGEMERLAKIASPKYAIMTNIGVSHIENLHSQKNILEQKLHITDNFTNDSCLILNGDDTLLMSIKGQTKGSQIYVGTSPNCDFYAYNIKFDENRTLFDFDFKNITYKAEIPVPGKHNVINALSALAICHVLNVPFDIALEKLKEYKTISMRQQILKLNDITIIDDSYNASPDSVKSSIDVLNSITAKRKIAILADMLELGNYSEKAHYQCGKYAAECGIDYLITIGEQAKFISQGAKEHNPNMKISSFNNNMEAISALDRYIKPGDACLIKGSRGMHTDEIVKAELEKNK